MRSKLITVLMLGAALGAAPALGDGRGHKHGHGHHAGYHYREPVRVVRYERYVEVPPPRVYYPAYSPRPVYVHYDEPRRTGEIMITTSSSGSAERSCSARSSITPAVTDRRATGC